VGGDRAYLSTFHLEKKEREQARANKANNSQSNSPPKQKNTHGSNLAKHIVDGNLNMARMNTGQKSAKSKNDLKTTYRKSVISEIESNSSQLKRMKSQKYENM